MSNLSYFVAFGLFLSVASSGFADVPTRFLKCETSDSDDRVHPDGVTVFNPLTLATSADQLKYSGITVTPADGGSAGFARSAFILSGPGLNGGSQAGPGARIIFTSSAWGVKFRYWNVHGFGRIDVFEANSGFSTTTWNSKILTEPTSKDGTLAVAQTATSGHYSASLKCYEITDPTAPADAAK